MDKLIPWLVGIPIGGLILYIIYKIDQKSLTDQLDQYFGDRQPLSDDEFYIQYFEAQGIPKEIPVKVREIFREQFGADFSRINNSDDFSEGMNFIWGFDSMADIEIIMAVEEEFDIKIEDEEAEKMISIQDIVVGVWNKKQKPNQSIEAIVTTPV